MESKQLKHMMAQKMANREHGSFQPYNPNLTKSQARAVFKAKMNKKRIPRDTPNSSYYYKRFHPYYQMSQEEYEKKYS